MTGKSVAEGRDTFGKLNRSTKPTAGCGRGQEPGCG